MPRSEKALVRPDLLVWGRTSAGLSMELVAKRAQLKPERLVGWENGTESPSVPQLRKLATIYKRPLAAFYLPRPPVSPKPIRDYRRGPSDPEPPASPDLLLAIRRSRERRELALDLYAELDEAPPDFHLRIKRDMDPERAAETIRLAVGVDAETKRAWRSPYDAFNGWRRSIEGLGVLVFQALDLDPEEARGFSMTEHPLPVLAELERQDDELCEWARQHVQFVALDEAIQIAATETLARFPRLVDANRSRSLADPFIIGLARARGLTVVTTEKAAATPGHRRPKIPDVCASFGVRCYSPLEMFRELGWRL